MSLMKKYYFGEMTFYPESGFGKFIPEKYDKIFRGYVRITKRKERGKMRS